MQVVPVRTRRVQPPKDDLDDILSRYITNLPNEDIVAISSKVVAICEGRCVPVDSVTKDDLVRNETSKILYPLSDNSEHMQLTQWGDVLIESAGIDTSNSDGFFILLPKSPYLSAKRIWQYLRKITGQSRLGVLITDSHAVPERRGVMGLALASFGFRPVRTYKGKQDLFGRNLSQSVVDLADSLAAAADVVMGEGDESTPLAVITDITGIKFYKKPIHISQAKRYTYISPKKDVYGPLLESKIWTGRKNDSSLTGPN